MHYHDANTASGLALPIGNYCEDDPKRILWGAFGHSYGELTFSKRLPRVGGMLSNKDEVSKIYLIILPGTIVLPTVLSSEVAKTRVV